MRIAAFAVASLTLGLLSGCGAGASDTRPPGIFPSFKAELYANPQQAPVCVPGPQGSPLGCTELVDRTLRTLHTLRDTIKARPDASRYRDTLAEIDKVDGAAKQFEDAGCRGALTNRCSVLSDNIVVNDVYNRLMSEDAPAPGRR